MNREVKFILYCYNNITEDASSIFTIIDIINKISFSLTSNYVFIQYSIQYISKIVSNNKDKQINEDFSDYSIIEKMVIDFVIKNYKMLILFTPTEDDNVKKKFMKMYFSKN